VGLFVTYDYRISGRGYLYPTITESLAGLFISLENLTEAIHSHSINKHPPTQTTTTKEEEKNGCACEEKEFYLLFEVSSWTL